MSTARKMPTCSAHPGGKTLKPCGLGTLLFVQQADLPESEGKARADSALWPSFYVVHLASEYV